MKTILALLLTTVLFATSSRADVVIYRGVELLTANANVDVGVKSLNHYLVVDFDGGQIGGVFFGRIAGSKKFSVNSVSNVGFNSLPFPKNKTETIIATGDSSTTLPTFTYDLTVFRGADANLLIRKTPVHTFAQRPNSLKGTSFSVSSDNVYLEQHSVLTFQGPATIEANNANQTIDQLLAAFTAALMLQGYTSL